MLIGRAGLNSIANQVSSQGFSVSHAFSKQTEANLSVSNFGNETKIGSSRFQQGNEDTQRWGGNATAKNMQDVQGTIRQFEDKQSYTQNATLAAIRQSTMDISA